MSARLPIHRDYNFAAKLSAHQLSLDRLPLETLQLNVTRLCNQACRHCHVDASPKRTEQMGRTVVDRCLELLARLDSLTTVDITGGAPELNPHFEYLVREARKLNKRVIVRHNLTVTFDGNPVTGASLDHLPEFFARNGVEVVSSLPYYQAYFTDKQRGRGVFEKSVESIRRLNQVGYGQDETGLVLNLVMNPVGPYLPPEQGSLEAEYKKALWKEHELRFNSLFVITNMPIHRFKQSLQRLGSYEPYMNRLVNAFNPQAAEGVMCRSLISVDYNGRLFDCDFNQMLDRQVGEGGQPLTVFDLEPDSLPPILFDAHCFGCTAGAGSSCGGTTT